MSAASILDIQADLSDKTHMGAIQTGSKFFGTPSRGLSQLSTAQIATLGLIAVSLTFIYLRFR